MKSLRTQLFASHLALVALMALVMLGAVANFLRLGQSIDHILRDNYKSVTAAQTMKESLERQDSAATFFLAGQHDKARKQFAQNVPIFEDALKFELANITERGERTVAAKLKADYAAYKTGVQSLLRGEKANPTQFYFTELEPRFLKIKGEAQQILDINQAAIVRADDYAKRDARQGALVGALMTLAALGLAIYGAKRAINSALTPLLALVLEAEQIGEGHLNRKIEMQREDEIGTLANAFNDMTAKLREARGESQKRLHRAQKMSDAALENLFDPVIVTDATATIVHLNKAAQGIFGLAVNLRGLPVSRVIHEPKISQAIEHAIQSEKISADEGEAGLISIQKNENARVYRIRATPMLGDDQVLLGAALVLEDVTHLRELDRLKTEFIGVASHELKTPVTSLLLSAQLLEEEAVGPLNETQKEVVHAQKEDLLRLDSLLRELLDLTKLEAGTTPPRFEWIAPKSLIDGSIRSIKTQLEKKSIEFSTFGRSDLPFVRADKSQIQRVLLNLLGNAIRHTPQGGSIRLEAEKTDHNTVLFRVSDSGDGIAPKYQQKIFERFAQVSDLEKGAPSGGAGLGLPISQAILAAHDSKISLQSEVGKGSVFSFELEAQTQ